MACGMMAAETLLDENRFSMFWVSDVICPLMEGMRSSASFASFRLCARVSGLWNMTYALVVLSSPFMKRLLSLSGRMTALVLRGSSLEKFWIGRFP